MEDIEKSEDTSFDDSATVKSKATIATTGQGKTIFNGTCRRCGKPVNNVEVINDKVKCPTCGADV